MTDAAPDALTGDLFRRESSHLVTALVRLLGPARLALAEDVAQEALLKALHAWRFGAPDNPRAWLLAVAKNRAIDILRRERKSEPLDERDEVSVELALSPDADDENQLAVMFAICDAALAPETHVSLILRLLCGLSSAEIARAFLVDVPTIDRRLHRARGHLATRPDLMTALAATEVRARQSSVELALYALLSEGYQANLPALCADALRLAELLLAAPAADHRSAHALSALCSLTAARLPSRLDPGGAIVPLDDQDRTRWDAALVARGVAHLGASADGATFTRWHLEAGIAFEHARAPSIAETDWPRVVALYDALATLAPSPVVAFNRAIARAEVDGPAAAAQDLAALAGDPKLARSSSFWAARADLARRLGDLPVARLHYVRAITLAPTDAERASYERRVATIIDG